MSEQTTSRTSHTAGGVPVRNAHHANQDTGDSRVPLSAEPGVYNNDGVRQVPISAEPGVYRHDDRNSPKEGTAGEQGVRIENEDKGIGSKV
ncbi:hypothetical protein ED733_002036 [Metarhizium rileyi]|uniref:Uncharacterized protein n=1 Tax=Metarhizium rileyi (strain RCEF 4871) TaxID=1649241 RepID=A0A5C6G5N7_METRR|nr:hypothetical protein ED733_002036 [Metarhizium rileyi]